MKKKDFPVQISPKQRSQIITLAEAFAAWKSELYTEKEISIVRIDPSARDNYIKKVRGACKKIDIWPGVCASWHVFAGSTIYNDPEHCLAYHRILCYDFPDPEYSVIAFMQEMFARVEITIPEKFTHLPKKTDNS